MRIGLLLSRAQHHTAPTPSIAPQRLLLRATSYLSKPHPRTASVRNLLGLQAIPLASPAGSAHNGATMVAPGASPGASQRRLRPSATPVTDGPSPASPAVPS